LCGSVMASTYVLMTDDRCESVGPLQHDGIRAQSGYFGAAP
jgi:hypothetical protein